MSGRLPSLNLSGVSIRGPGGKLTVIAADNLPMFYVDSLKFCTWVRGQLKFDSLIHSRKVPSVIELSDNLVISSLPDGEKKITFNIDMVSDGFTRTIFMPDHDVYLGNLPNIVLLNEGDLLTRDDTELIALPIGVAGQVLVSDGTLPEWSNQVTRINQGTTNVTIATSYTIQLTDSNTLDITSTPGNDQLFLPDATTLPPGWEVHVICNAASTANLNINNNGTTFTRVYGAGESTTIRLRAALTAAGDWSFSNPNATLNNTILVSVTGGNYTSISEAIASIVGSGPTNRYSIIVGPGTYVEPPIVMQPYVDIIGGGVQSAIIQPTDPSNTMFTAASFASISNCVIQGATTGTAISADSVVNFLVERCFIRDHQSAIIATNPLGSGVVSRVQVNRCEFENITVNIFNASAAGLSADVLTLITSLNIFRGSNAPGFTMFSFSGPRTIAFLSNESITGGATGPAGTCVYIEDGSRLITEVFLLRTFTTGIHIANIGAAPVIALSSLGIELCTTNINIEHPGTTGQISGQLDQGNTAINPAAQLSIFIQDTSAPDDGVKLAGKFYLGDSFNTITNFSPHIQQSSILGKITGGTLTSGGGLTVNISAGNGYLNINAGVNLKFIEWTASALALPANARSYIYIDNNNAAQSALARPDQQENILLGRVGTVAAGLEFIDRSNLDSEHVDVQYDEYERDIFGALFARGSITTNAGTEMGVTNGRFYYAYNQFNPSGFPTGGNWTEYFHVGGVFTRTPGVANVNTTQYDDGNNLVAIPGGQFVKHSFYIVGDGVDEEYFFVFGQATYASLVLAQAAALPTPPSYFEEGIVIIAAIIVEEGNGIIDILDERPRPTTQTSGTTGVTDHGALSGLLDNDHPQYLLINGTNAMAGNLQMGANNILTTGLVDGVTVSAHAARHIPGGADALPVGTPVTLNATSGNIEGILNSFARQDHQHALDITSLQANLDHNSLQNLTVGDPHTQYFLHDGTRVMTGNIDMGGFSISDSNLVSGTTSNFATVQVVNGANTVSLVSPALLASYTLTLPVDDGNANEVLTTDGTGALSWTVAAPQSHHDLLDLATGDDHPQYFRTDGTRLMAGDILTNFNNITNVNSLSYANSGFTATLQPPTLAASYTLTLPVDDGTAGEFLQTDGTGVLSWFDLTGAVNPFPQYLRIDGTSVMTGNLQMGGSDVQLTGGDVDFGTGGGNIVNALNVEWKSSTTVFSVNIDAPAGLVADYTMTWPLNGGAANQFLQTDGAGSMSWITPDHTLLTNLLVDDHPQYLLVDGTRPMSGDLQMGNNDITTTGLVDGVTVSAHATRHMPTGADPLVTAAPITDLSSSTGNTIGSANSFARSDHTHALDLTEINSTLSHSALTNLLVDDHPQYLLVNGTRAMTGNLNMDSVNSYNINNIGTANFIDTTTNLSVGIKAPVGVDTPYTLALPINVGSPNQYLTANGTGNSTWTTVNHSFLTGLLDDTHPQYLLVNGVRAMTGDLDLDGNDLVDAGSLELREGSGAGDVITLSAPVTLATSYSLTLPTDDGAIGQYLQTDGSGVLSWQTPSSGFDGVGLAELESDDLLNPTTADWAVNSLAPSVPDPINSGIHVRAYDDTVEEGAGFSIRVPAGKTAVSIQIEYRKQTAAAGDIIFNLYTRRINNPGLVSAWSIPGNSSLSTITGISDADWHYHTFTAKLFSSYGAAVQPQDNITSYFELTRNPADGTTDDVFVGRVIVNFA